MVVNTAEIRSRIQAEIENHLALAAALEEKLTLLGQIENLANDVGVKTGGRLQEAAVAPDAKVEAKPESKPGGSNVVIPPAGQTIQGVPQAAKEGAGNGAAKNAWATMQLGFQAYISGKLDKALELFKEARELNPSGFEKTWATMTSVPAYSSVARDKYFVEGLFTPK